MGGAEAAAHHAIQVNALKASGVIVRLDVGEWLKILERTERPLVVIGRGGVFKKHNQYLTSYRGLAFFTTSPDTIVLPPRCEVVRATKISIPDV
ncbi:MAG TPA: hypothetical protein VFB46_08670 [Gemmatimonadaceae bacterium]|nr:hypothetical protein [Gemmatimonadaceae bacterium]